MQQAKPETKRMSGAQKRKRSKIAAAANTGGQKAANGPGVGKQPGNANNGKPKDHRVAAPAGVSKKNNKAIQSQAFNLVRQKLVASLMQVLPQSNNWNNGGSGDAAGWGNNNNNVPTNRQGGWNGNNKNNKNNNKNNNNINNSNTNMNRGPSNAQGGWNNKNANNNMNRTAANSQGIWNNNNNSINNRNSATSNPQGYWGSNNNNNMNRASNLQGGWNNNSLTSGLSTSSFSWNNNNSLNRGSSSSQGGWNNNSGSNMNQSASSMSAAWGSNNSSMNQGGSTAWNINNQRQYDNNNSYSSAWNNSADAPAPPPWNNGNISRSQNVAQQSDSMWGNNYGDDPRNAGGREFFSQFDSGDNNDIDNNNDFDNVGSSNLKFTIVDMNMPGGKILGRNQNILKSAFNQALASVILKADSRFPPIQLKFSRFIQNTYKISVASPQCVPVLQNIVDRLTSLWPGSKLRLVPYVAPVKLSKATLYIGSGALNRDAEEILLIIERQNAGLRTDKWRFIHRREKDDGVLLIVAIDKQSKDFLFKSDNSEGKVFFLTSTATIKLAKKPEGPVGGGALAIMPKPKSKPRSKNKQKSDKAN